MLIFGFGCVKNTCRCIFKYIFIHKQNIKLSLVSFGPQRLEGKKRKIISTSRIEDLVAKSHVKKKAPVLDADRIIRYLPTYWIGLRTE